MTVDEVVVHKDQLEARIHQLLIEFMTNTGCVVDRINVRTERAETVGGIRHIFIESVRLEVSLP